MENGLNELTKKDMIAKYKLNYHYCKICGETKMPGYAKYGEEKTCADCTMCKTCSFAVATNSTAEDGECTCGQNRNTGKWYKDE